MRITRWIVGLLALLVALVAAASFHPMVRSVYRALRPSTTYDEVAPDVPAMGSPAVLVFSKTNGFRHAEAIVAGRDVLRGIGERRGWSIFETENGAVFEDSILERFQAVVWLNTSGAPLNQAQRSALQSRLESGTGFVGVHAALDDSHRSWEWYVREVVGANFIGHAMGLLPATVRIERQDHPALPLQRAAWERVDEWYSFDRSVRGDPGVEVLASLDESTYEPRLKLLWIDEDLAMGDHPILWTRQIGAGRAVLSAFGHSAESMLEPDHQSVLEAALDWVMQVEPVAAK